MLVTANPVADALGIAAVDALALMAAVEDGLPLMALDRVARAVAPADNKFSRRIVARSTLARRRQAGSGVAGRLSVEEGTRLARLANVWVMALDVWGGEDAARRFMFAAHPLLEGRRPVDVVLESELGRPVVEGILGRLQYGAAV